MAFATNGKIENVLGDNEFTKNRADIGNHQQTP